MNEIQGIWRVMPSPAITEIIAQSGFNFQIFDLEHGSYDYQSLENDIRACELHQCIPYVRVGGLNQAEVQRCLDLGAQGIVFPQLQDEQDFKKATLMIKYAPEGTRGFNPFIKAWGYGFKTEAITPICFPIVESLKAVEQLDDILALPGLGMVYIGSYDLSAQLGCPGQISDPRVLNLVATIIQKCVKASVPVGLMVANNAQYQAYKALGVSVFLHTVDSDQLKKAFTGIIKGLKGNVS